MLRVKTILVHYKYYIFRSINIEFKDKKHKIHG